MVFDTKYQYTYLIIAAIILITIVPRPSYGFNEHQKSTSINPEVYSRRQVRSNAKELIKESTKEDKDNGYKSKEQKDSRLEMELVLMWDYKRCNGANIENPEDTEDKKEIDTDILLRRSSIDFKNEFKKDWQAKLEINFNNEDSSLEVGDAYINFTKWDYARLIIGQSKEPSGLEKLTSSNNISFMERSMMTSAFAPGCNTGFGLSGDISRFTWAIGVYEAVEQKNKNNTYAVTSRLTFVPWKHKKNILHLGISGSSRDMDGKKYEIKESAEVYNAEKIITNDKISVDRMNLLGLEISLISGDFRLQAEHMSSSIVADKEDDEDVSYEGYYLQGSYFLYGDPPKYKEGIFSEVEPEGKFGTLEFVSRYSVLDVRDNDKGIKAANLTFGINYYINEHVRLMSNYVTTDLVGDLEDTEENAEALSFRIQCVF